MRSIWLLLYICTFFSCQQKVNSSWKTQDNYFISDNISNQQVTSFVEDSEGYIWIGTSRGLNKYNGYEYWQYMQGSNDRLSLSGNDINSLLVDSEKRFWIATENGISLQLPDGRFRTIPIENKSYPPAGIEEAGNGDIIINLRSDLHRYNPTTGIFEFFHHYDSYNFLNKFLLDKNNHLWIITINSIQCYDYPSMQLIKKYEVAKQINLFYAYLVNDHLYVTHGKGNLKIIDTNNTEQIAVPDGIENHPILSQALITQVYPYADDKILLNTHKNGLYIYDFSSDKAYHQSEQEFPFDAPDQQITSFFSDSQDNLWIGTLSHSFKVIYKYSQQFNNNHILHAITEEHSITALAFDEKEYVWIATSSDNLYIYNAQTNKIENRIDLKEFFTEDPFFQDKISAIHIDEENNIWFKTDSKITKCEYKNQELIRKESFNMGVPVYDLAEDRQGNIWTGTQNNFVYIIDKKKNRSDTLNLFATNYRYHRTCLLTVDSGEILTASSHHYLNLIDPSTREVTHYSLKDVIDEEHFIPVALYEDADRNIWIALLNQGLYKFSFKTGKAEKIANTPSKNIVSIIEDEDRNLWLGTLYGLSKYDIDQQRFFSFYAYDGIGGNQFNRNCGIRLSSGNLIFGGTHGLTIFDPAIINIQRQIPLYFEQILPHKPLHLDDMLELNHKDNDLTISFVALDYSRYPRVRYYYKMEGVDNNWIDARNNRQVTYSNLSAGDYIFRVYITSNDNTTVLAENAIDINVQTSPWLSTWALLIYSILIIFLFIYINNLYLRIKNNKNRAKIALREKEHERHINEMNMSFFTNISHEFRTPLTMIAGPVSTILKSESLDEKNKYLLSIVNRNINRMLRLVNQILYFNKLDHDALSLETSYVDVVHEINEIIELFSINDNVKNIKIKKSGLNESVFMLLDKDKLEKILNNILSNAFKYTPSGGNISVGFDIISKNEAQALFASEKITSQEESEYVKLIIEDDGPGIPEDKLENIFEKYYQIDSNSSTGGTYNYGTGIGLYFTRRLVALHHGYIKAGNKVGGGAVFTIIIPVERSKPGVTSQQDTVLVKEDYNDLSGMINRNVSAVNKDDEKYTVLIIDDDAEVSAYLRVLLQDDYNLINKYSADSAYSALEEIQPDLILCDVIMPGMSGYDFCREIKHSQDFSHIPVILLTAKSSMDEQIEGLDTGANAYISKPFEPNYLLAVVKSQLLNLQNIRNLLKDSTRIPQTDSSLSASDNEFMKKLYELMENELSNNELNISEITKKIGMSRTKFYLKLKGLTGENPNAFFRKYKLNRAAELLKSGNYNISGVATLTGFSTLSHFSISFKKQFGVSPKEYK